VWVNGTQVINNWTNHAPTWDTSSPITLTAGQQFDPVVEYFNSAGSADG
jgi:hypothetical protein